jgi:4-amino-4-deoxy-L-arabinose transferase-like glycosyltransferase
MAGAAAAAVAVALTYLFFLRRASIIDRMMTEIQAGTLLVWFSFTLVRALQNGKPAWFVAAGGLLGALVLTKAFFLYPAIGTILALLVFYLWPSAADFSRWRAVGLVAIAAISMSAVIAPWIVRNWIHFDSFEISQRGGVVLYARACKNQMNNVEYIGAYFYYAPDLLKPLLGRMLGYSRDDLQEGGRLQRLNRDRSGFSDRDLAAERAARPEDAVTFYRKARAEAARLRKEYRDLGVENSSIRADRELRNRALRLIATDPMQNLKTTPLFLWRGSGLVGFPFILLATIALFRRDPESTGMTLLSAGTLVFLALTTHFLPRYMAPMVPAMIAAVTALIAWMIVRVASKTFEKAAHEVS